VFSFIFETLPAVVGIRTPNVARHHGGSLAAEWDLGPLHVHLARELSTVLFSMLAIEDTVTVINDAVALLVAVCNSTVVGRAARCARTC
jgi:hypothetical protein